MYLNVRFLEDGVLSLASSQCGQAVATKTAVVTTTSAEEKPKSLTRWVCYLTLFPRFVL